MFRSAVIKLTAWYVAALVMIVLLFSVPIYNFASTRFERSAERQGDIFTRRIPGNNRMMTPAFENERRQVRDEERAQLFRQILYVDMLIVLLGGVASYFFARASLRPIEEAHAAQSRFTADASHELRTPLATMQAEIEVALKDKKAEKQALRSTLESNLEEIERLKNLSDQLLLLTKIDSQSLAKNSFSLSKATVHRITALEKQYNASFEHSIQKNITMNGDELLIMQALTILVDNAMRYANETNPKISITLSKISGRPTIKVQDNGPGISDTDLPFIFDRFYRGTKATPGGHGLGLALAKEIVEKHGGSISAKNSTDGGAEFSLSL